MDSLQYLKDKMQKSAQHIYLRLTKFLPPQFKFNNDQFISDFCSIGIEGNQIILIHVKNTANGFKIHAVITQAFQENEFAATLIQLVKQNQLTDMQCCWMLSPNTYQILLLEELPVTAEEFQSAIRWKVRDLISFPIDDAVIDTFSVPLAKIPNSKSTMMVAITQTSYLKKYVDAIHESKLYLKIISIAELGFRNITALYEQDESSSVLLYLQNKNSYLIITKNQTLYLSRKLEWGLDFLVAPSALDNLALEVQRSIDYYQSQWRNPAPARILISPGSAPSEDIATYLTQRLHTNVQYINLKAQLLNQNISTDLLNQYLAVVGGAFQIRVKADATAN